MATNVLRHSDDDGALSIFISGTQILFVCEHRHWWTLEAGEAGEAQKAAARRAVKGVLPRRASSADRSVAALSDRFGPAVFDVMSLK